MKQRLSTGFPVEPFLNMCNSHGPRHSHWIDQTRESLRHKPMLGPEATLIVLCLTGAVPSELSHWLQRMQNPPVARSPYLLRMGLWRAFHSRWPVLMRCARTQMVRDLAEQFDAEDASAAALNAIDNLLARHGIATSKPS